MTPALARLKRGVRAGVARCAGVDGAGVTAGRCRSTAGDWNNLNSPSFPPLDCALALDEVAIAQGQRPELLHALAGELGFTLIALPDLTAPAGEVGLLVLSIVTELGELSARVRDALADDGQIGPREAGVIDAEVGDLIEQAARLRSHLRVLQAGEKT